MREINSVNRFNFDCVLNIYHAGIDLALLRNTLGSNCHSLYNMSGEKQTLNGSTKRDGSKGKIDFFFCFTVSAVRIVVAVVSRIRVRWIPVSRVGRVVVLFLASIVSVIVSVIASGGNVL